MCDEYPIVYDILWSLSFNQDIQEQLRSNPVFMAKLSYLGKECDNEQLRKIAHGLLWNLEINHPDHSISEINDRGTFDIMISYSHKDKVLCKQIYDELIKSGYRVWIDFDQMHGNTMDAMAEAIEQSHTIIICMSENYRRSNYCRAEAHYAFQRQRKIVPVLLQQHYKPDGWLLFLIGQLLYVDFIKHEFSRAMTMLWKELKRTYIAKTDVAFVQPERNIIDTAPKLHLPPKFPNDILDWTQRHVQEWLTGHNLNQMSHLLADCNGRSLLYLDDYIRNGDINQILNLLQEDSLRKTGQTLSLTELSCFRSLMDEQKQLMVSSISIKTKMDNVRKSF